MKKVVASVLAVTMLAGCSGEPAVQSSSGGVPTQSVSGPENQNGALKTGMSVTVDLSGSRSAAADGQGLAHAEITLVAVTVGDDGVIHDCIIDMVQSNVNFDGAGQLTSDTTATFASKNELGDGYGMKKGSSIGKEWDEQVAGLAAYAVGKTVAELKGIAVDAQGIATDADLTATITVSVSNFLTAIEDAVSNATHMGARAGDRLALSSSTHIANSKSAENK